MKRSLILMMLVGLVGVTPCLLAQKMVPFAFVHESDSSTAPSLKVITEVHETASTFMRLYFNGTQLGKESYLLLEATDGAHQRLTGEDLKNWNFSSAYFNGNTVKISLFSAVGELNKVVINSIKVSDEKIVSADGKETVRKDLTTQTGNANSPFIDYDELPHAAAVGRFTNGSTSFGTGWIAPNGAIITSWDNVYGVSIGRDIIEFNIPPSEGYGIVNHPDPSDQYPVKYRSETQAFISFEFKRKHHYSAANEDHGTWFTTWGILDALPNSTGLRPGERQQQYFRLAPNLGSFTLKQKTVLVDIFHYGETSADLLDDGSNYRTLRRYTTQLVPQSEYIASGQIDIESFMVYNLDQGNPTFTDSDTGAPIVYSGYNIAMGVHSDFYNYAPAVGVGFKDASLQSNLNNYFSSKMIYVDQGSLWESSTGSIDKPYLEIYEGIEYAEIGGIVNIVKGSYDEPMYITKAVTLKAPVGHVIIGQGDINARKATLPEEFLMDDDADVLAAVSPAEEEGFDLKCFPNPFTTSTNINYDIARSTPVRVSVYDRLGNKIKSLLEESQEPGSHSVVWDGKNQNGSEVTPGLYVVRIETPEEFSIVKTIKR